jgi:uncharacterized membrane protein YeiB
VNGGETLAGQTVGYLAPVQLLGEFPPRRRVHRGNHAVLPVATRALAAVGRTAFSNYILQTVLATSIFYGHGLGLFGQVSRIEALGVVVSSEWCRSRFRYCGCGISDSAR